MINIGTLVKVNAEKAKALNTPWVLRFEGIGIIVKPPKQWFGNAFDSLGYNNIGHNNPNGDVVVEFYKERVRIPSTWLSVVEAI